MNYDIKYGNVRNKSLSNKTYLHEILIGNSRNGKGHKSTDIKYVNPNIESLDSSL